MNLLNDNIFRLGQGWNPRPSNMALFHPKNKNLDTCQLPWFESCFCYRLCPSLVQV